MLACSLAAQALSEGRAVGLLADDDRQLLVTPGRGPRQLWRILGELVDAQATKDKLTLIDIPDGQNVIATYPIAVVKDATQAALGQKFVEYLLSADGQAVLQKYGFAPGNVPPGEPT